MEKKLESLLRDIASFANQRGLRVGLVGGTVRDIFLGYEPVDVDLVVEGDAIALAEDFFSRKKYDKIVKYRYYKTCSVFLPDGMRIDFATAREEYYPKCGSRPVITPSTIEKDLFRRDFTINAMAYLLVNDGETPLGNFLDPFQGKRHLEERVLEVIHDRSFCDDPIRILRGIRYSVRLGFRFSDRCLRLIAEAKENKYVDLVDENRLRDELNLIYKEPDPNRILSVVNELLGPIFDRILT